MTDEKKRLVFLGDDAQLNAVADRIAIKLVATPSVGVRAQQQVAVRLMDRRNRWHRRLWRFLRRR